MQELERLRLARAPGGLREEQSRPNGNLLSALVVGASVAGARANQAAGNTAQALLSQSRVAVAALQEDLARCSGLHLPRFRCLHKPSFTATTMMLMMTMSQSLKHHKSGPDSAARVALLGSGRLAIVVVYPPTDSAPASDPLVEDRCLTPYLSLLNSPQKGNSQRGKPPDPVCLDFRQISRMLVARAV